MQSEDKDIKITALQAKIKYLEKQISERVRSFLLRNPGKKLTPSTKTKGVQVQFDYEANRIAPMQVSVASSLANSGVRQYKNQDSNTREELTNKEQSELSDCLSNVWLAEVVGKLLDPQLQERESSLKRETSSTESSSDLWKLKKKYARLQEKLKFETQVANCAKEGLLKSEQQNYQFRLKIKELTQNKNTQTSGSGSFRNNQNKSTSQTEWEKTEKQQFEERISQLKQEIASSKQTLAQNQKLLDQLKQSKQFQLHQQIEALKKQIQKLKDLTYELSNCIPLQQNCEDHQFFRPESIEEVSTHLRRVSSYCKQIDKHQNERQSQMKQDKAMFVRLVQKIKQQVSKNSRTSVWNMMKSDRQLAPYARIFSESQIGGGNNLINASQAVEEEQQESECQVSPTRQGQNGSPRKKPQQIIGESVVDVCNT